MSENEKVALATIQAVERRDMDRLRKLYHPEVTFHWQPGLPYSGKFSGPGIAEMTEIFSRVWGPLQQNDDYRRMDARVLASKGDLVVIEYTWRAVRGDGATFQTDIVAKYRIKDGRLIEAQMFYYDLCGVIEFIGDQRS